jgi:hypothetical protein
MVLLSKFIRLYKENIIKHHNPHPLIVDEKRDIKMTKNIHCKACHKSANRLSFIQSFFLLLKSLTLHARIIKM